ncbi:hypothetical protein BCF53_108178 [Reinekea marinisedimentorum]|uniref:Uncharacterized protein n=1 Tax=Reinekea marinisedimentorum TaxID=230495 RepID=A0A4V2UJR8_9GAMM|nr:hypothetical protein BCF53_108178 [Reinekea marinisedimentorum]
MAKQPCRFCQQVRWGGLMVAIMILIGYGLMKAMG